MPEVWTWPAATAVRIVDGDTFVARLTRQVQLQVPAQDLGFHAQLGPLELAVPVAFEQKLRLNRINAPAISKPEGKIASQALATLLLGRDDLLIQTVGPYKYGDEWMCEVTLPEGTNISDQMVLSEHAVAWSGRGPRPE